MKSFCVVRDNSTGRIYLEEEGSVPEKGVSVLQYIESDSWTEARDMVNTKGMYHVEGYGYYDND